MPRDTWCCAPAVHRASPARMPGVRGRGCGVRCCDRLNDYRSRVAVRLQAGNFGDRGSRRRCRALSGVVVCG